MKCQSIITEEEYQELLKGELFTNDKKSLNEGTIDNETVWLIAYDWMADKLEKKTGIRPYRWPRWVWIKWEGKEEHFNVGNCLSDSFTVGDFVLLTLDIPEERLLLSDFDLWHHPLNGWAAIEDREEDNAFEQWREDNHLPWFIFDENEVKDCDKNLVKKARDIIIKSWDNIFDLTKENDFSRCKNEEKTIQGVCWEFYPEDVIVAEKYHVDEGLVIANKKRDRIYPYQDDECNDDCKEDCNERVIELNIH